MVKPDPQGNFYRAPYPILSFLVGLYCDPAWSKAAFDKWKDSERHVKKEGRGISKPDGSDEPDETYLWDGYLDAYADMPLAAARIISLKVPENEPKDAGGRSKPTPANFIEIFPYLVRELSQKPKGEKYTANPFNFGPPAKLLSAIGKILLVGETPDERWDLPQLPILQQLAAARGTDGVVGPLTALKEDLLTELTSFFCW